jgi:phospholipid transport system substrate-binding protein
MTRESKALTLAGQRAAPIAAALLVLLALAAASSVARAGQGPAQFLTALSTRAVTELTEPGLDTGEKERRFRQLIGEGFDIPAIGRFVLGRYWRRADAATQDAFLRVFEDMIVYRFLPLFEDYSGERVVVGTAVPFGENDQFFAVSSVIARSEGEPIAVDWRVHRVGDGFKIVDIVAEGVSIAVTLRSEYGSALKNNGGDVAKLVEELRAKLAQI